MNEKDKEHFLPAVIRDGITLILIPLFAFALFMLLQTSLQVERLDERSAYSASQMLEMKQQIERLDRRIQTLERRN